MSYREAEIAAMQQAIIISAFGLGSASPNPPVGCVILDRDGTPVGQGYHRRKGEPHAEANALAAAGSRAVGGTAVVTLEPCNHHGRTPPCHQALLDAGIARVLIALIDPTSRGEGGAARLREAGVDVDVGLLADEALVVLGSWLSATESGRPRVHWSYEIAPDGARSPARDPLAPSDIRRLADAVLHPDGRVDDGGAAPHGAAFRLPAAVPMTQPVTALRTIHAAGARILLLHGDTAVAAPFLERGLVDEIEAFLPMSHRSMSPRHESVLPPGFHVTAITRLAAGVLVQARRTSPPRATHR